MMGRLLLDMAVVVQRTLDKLEKDAAGARIKPEALAWVMDTDDSEREHGVTIHVADKVFETDLTRFTLLDAPGHQDYVPKMIAGAAKADLAVLVVDASPNNFEAGLKGQTIEHIHILRAAGIRRIIVAVNKLDALDWSRTRYAEIKQQMTGFFQGYFGGLLLKMDGISFVPVSGRNGDNVVRRSSAEDAAWYTGPTLLEELEKPGPLRRQLQKPFRMVVSDLFKPPQSPMAVCGRIAAGTVQVGDAVLVQPGDRTAYIKMIQENGPGDMLDWAVAGHQVILHLSNIDTDFLREGDVLCDPNRPIKLVNEFTITAVTYAFMMPWTLDVFCGHFEPFPASTKLLKEYDGPKVGAPVLRNNPRLLREGSVGRIKVTLRYDGKLPLDVGDRVFLRSSGKVVAAGRVKSLH
jgi:elongation factor 1 alpha-like protein